MKHPIDYMLGAAALAMGVACLADGDPVFAAIYVAIAIYAVVAAPDEDEDE